MKTVTIYATLIAVAIALCVGVGGGWLVKGWKDGAALTVAAQADTKAAQADATAAADTYKGVLSDFAKAAQGLQEKNTANTDAMLALNSTLGKQANAIKSLKDQYATLVVGACTYNADGDELLNESYKAAFPVPASATPAR